MLLTNSAARLPTNAPGTQVADLIWAVGVQVAELGGVIEGVVGAVDAQATVFLKVALQLPTAKP